MARFRTFDHPLCNALMFALGIWIGGTSNSAALMPPHCERTQPEDGGVLDGRTIVYFGYSFDYAPEPPQVTRVGSREAVPHATESTCRWEGSGDCPGCQQERCEARITLDRVVPGATYRVSFVGSTITVRAASKDEQHHLVTEPFKHQKVAIDVTRVTRASIERLGVERPMAERDLEEFARAWQRADKPTADKYRWDYAVSLTLNSGDTRRFLIQGERIQESGDWTTWRLDEGYDAADLWQRSRATPPASGGTPADP